MKCKRQGGGSGYGGGADLIRRQRIRMDPCSFRTSTALLAAWLSAGTVHAYQGSGAGTTGHRKSAAAPATATVSKRTLRTLYIDNGANSTNSGFPFLTKQQRPLPPPPFQPQPVAFTTEQYPTATATATATEATTTLTTTTTAYQRETMDREISDIRALLVQLEQYMGDPENSKGQKRRKIESAYNSARASLSLLESVQLELAALEEEEEEDDDEEEEVVEGQASELEASSSDPLPESDSDLNYSFETAWDYKDALQQCHQQQLESSPWIIETMTLNTTTTCMVPVQRITPRPPEIPPTLAFFYKEFPQEQEPTSAPLKVRSATLSIHADASSNQRMIDRAPQGFGGFVKALYDKVTKPMTSTTTTRKTMESSNQEDNDSVPVATSTASEIKNHTVLVANSDGPTTAVEQEPHTSPSVVAAESLPPEQSNQLLLYTQKLQDMVQQNNENLFDQAAPVVKEQLPTGTTANVAVAVPAEEETTMVFEDTETVTVESELLLLQDAEEKEAVLLFHDAVSSFQDTEDEGTDALFRDAISLQEETGEEKETKLLLEDAASLQDTKEEEETELLFQDTALFQGTEKEKDTDPFFQDGASLWEEEMKLFFQDEASPRDTQVEPVKLFSHHASDSLVEAQAEEAKPFSHRHAASLLEAQVEEAKLFSNHAASLLEAQTEEMKLFSNHAASLLETEAEEANLLSHHAASLLETEAEEAKLFSHQAASGRDSDKEETELFFQDAAFRLYAEEEESERFFQDASSVLYAEEEKTERFLQDAASLPDTGDEKTELFDQDAASLLYAEEKGTQLSSHSAVREKKDPHLLYQDAVEEETQKVFRKIEEGSALMDSILSFKRPSVDMIDSKGGISRLPLAPPLEKPELEIENIISEGIIPVVEKTELVDDNMVLRSIPEVEIMELEDDSMFSESIAPADEKTELEDENKGSISIPKITKVSFSNVHEEEHVPKQGDDDELERFWEAYARSSKSAVNNFAFARDEAYDNNTPLEATATFSSEPAQLIVHHKKAGNGTPVQDETAATKQTPPIPVFIKSQLRSPTFDIPNQAPHSILAADSPPSSVTADVPVKDVLPKNPPGPIGPARVTFLEMVLSVEEGPTKIMKLKNPSTTMAQEPHAAYLNRFSSVDDDAIEAVAKNVSPLTCARGTSVTRPTPVEDIPVAITNTPNLPTTKENHQSTPCNVRVLPADQKESKTPPALETPLPSQPTTKTSHVPSFVMRRTWANPKLGGETLSGVPHFVTKSRDKVTTGRLQEPVHTVFSPNGRFQDHRSSVHHRFAHVNSHLSTSARGDTRTPPAQHSLHVEYSAVNNLGDAEPSHAQDSLSSVEDTKDAAADASSVSHSAVVSPLPMEHDATTLTKTKAYRRQRLLNDDGSQWYNQDWRTGEHHAQPNNPKRLLRGGDFLQ